MKYFAFIFSLYMLIIACLPCADSNDKDECQTIVAQEQHKNNSHHHEQEDCSPFCYCSCCQTVCSNKVVDIVIVACTTLQEKKNDFLLVELKDTPHNFWQPPKLS